VPAPTDKENKPSTLENGALLTTGEMARCSSNTLRTVRFYEEEGILRPARRTEGGHRLFEKTELDRLMLVTDMRMAGLSLDEIKQVLEVKQSGASGGEAARKASRILSTRMDELRDKLLVLTRLREDLSETSELMSGCSDCHDVKFPHGCDSCSVMTSRPTLPRSLRVLWSTNGARPEAVEPAKSASGNGRAERS
jgi:MerR family Zn(II)-responsive transcriptional regulator of zntA